MNDRPVLPRVPALPLSQDWDALRAEGLRRIQQLSGAIWTDHNSHDPGITTLELMAYALTDLSYRMNLPTVDLLTDPGGQIGPTSLSGFVPAHEILPTAPRTAADYRRLLLRIEGVANAWAIARSPGRAETPVFADAIADALSHDSLNADGQANTELALSGLWDIRLDLEPDPVLGAMNETALEFRATSGELKGVVLRLDCVSEAFVTGAIDATRPRDGHAADPAVAVPSEAKVFSTSITLGFAVGPDTVMAPCLVRVVEDRPRFDRPPVVVTPAAIDVLLAEQGPEGLVPRFWDKQRARAALVARVMAALQANRGLCEDFLSVTTVDPFRVGVCADVEVAPDGDLEEVQAAVFHAIERYLAPHIRYRTLDEMLSQGQGVETISNGPFHDTAFRWQGQPVFTKPGFVTDADLAAADLRQAAQVSDIVNLVMDIPGVTAIHGITLRAYDGLGLAMGDPQRWTLPVPQGMQPTFYPEGSKLLFHRGGIPYRAQPTEFARTLDALRAADRREVYVPAGQVLPQPVGRWRNLDDFQPVQHDFPETYGIGAPGLPKTAPEGRVAQARQFKAYLAVFDQLLADYLAQLAGLRRIFSLDNTLGQTWFSLDISTRIAGTRLAFAPEFLTDPGSYVDPVARARLTESEDDFLQRRNRVLDHLVARFAERFADYATLMFRVADNRARTEAELIADKIGFLREYPVLSRMRGQGANMRPEDPALLWDSANVSGLEMRAGRLLGIDDLTRRDLHCAGHMAAFMAIRNVDGGLRLVVLPAAEGEDPLFVSAEVFPDDAAAEVAAEAAYRAVRDRGGLVVGVRQNTLRFEVMLVGDGGFGLTHRPAFDTQADATAAARAIILRYDALLAEDICNSEGMHLIEHILLRPRVKGDALMPFCLPKGAEPCGDEDPYSFRASVVLPYWPARFREVPFRDLVERMLREEAPAHVQLRICWVGQRQMADLDRAHRAWLTALRAGPSPQLSARTADLIAVLASLSTVYPAATLHDCDLGEDDRPVTLGASALGLF
jgi:hypothetical protein